MTIDYCDVTSPYVLVVVGFGKFFSQVAARAVAVNKIKICKMIFSLLIKL